VPFYALITGFLEKSDPSPEEALAREVQEELGLQAQGTHFIGHYAFARQNQIIMAYHVPATGVITLNDELADYKRIAPAKARYWPSSTGLALRDWLVAQGHEPQAMDLPRL
jgi:NAD+ diphosphatase